MQRSSTSYVYGDERPDGGLVDGDDGDGDDGNGDDGTPVIVDGTVMSYRSYRFGRGHP
jgi:hypothetical protein